MAEGKRALTQWGYRKVYGMAESGTGCGECGRVHYCGIAPTAEEHAIPRRSRWALAGEHTITGQPVPRIESKPLDSPALRQAMSMERIATAVERIAASLERRPHG